MKNFNFRKTVMRNDFTTIFGGFGRRRNVIIKKNTLRCVKRAKMQKVRRAHQGWRNKTFGTINALKVRRLFGRRKPVSQLRK